MLLDILREEIGIGKCSTFVKYQINQVRNEGIIIIFRKLRSLLKVLILLFRVLFLSIMLLPVALFIRIIRPFVLVRVGKLINCRIGHYAFNTELYLCERDAGLQPRKAFDIFFNNSKISCNQQLKKMWARTRTLRMWNVSRYLYFSNKLLPGYKKHIILTSDRDIYNLVERMQAHLSFTIEEERKGREELCKIGIPDSAKFVCFHARDASYLNTILPKGNWKYHNHRDSDINAFGPAVKELVKRGYHGLRMGAVVSKRLQFTESGIIDYAVKSRTDFMDIFLGAKCYFYLGDPCGINSIPFVFRRPVAGINVLPLEYAPSWGRNTLFIPKKLWLPKEHRFMSFREILESAAGRFLYAQQYDQIEIDIVDNTSEEIKALAIEMDERLKGTWQTTEEDEELQRRFWSFFKKSKLHGTIKARIGADFLKQNQDLLK